MSQHSISHHLHAHFILFLLPLALYAPNIPTNVEYGESSIHDKECETAHFSFYYHASNSLMQCTSCELIDENISQRRNREDMYYMLFLKILCCLFGENVRGLCCTLSVKVPDTVM